VSGGTSEPLHGRGSLKVGSAVAADQFAHLWLSSGRRRWPPYPPSQADGWKAICSIVTSTIRPHVTSSILIECLLFTFTLMAHLTFGLEIMADGSMGARSF
jgi:hypothetical protein